MKKYQSYKPSGIEWIGEIPSNWDVRRIKYLFESILEKSIDGSEELLSVSEKKGIVPRRELKDENEELTRSESLEGYLKVEKDDLVNNIMLMWKRGLGFSNYKGIVSPSYSVFRLYKPNIPSYWNYLLRTDLYITEYRRNSTGVIESRLRLYDDSFGDIYSVLPPLSEQIQIVKFLDEKTELIDKLISTKERKITLLKEQRISLINQVVTKGLNPNVKMKDSGVEWIGEIPEHWEVGRLKHICKENVKSLSNNTNPNYELDYIEISDVDSDGNIKNTTHYTFSESPSRCRRIVSRGDIILSTVRTYLRSIGLIENEVSDLICSTGFSVLTPNYGINSKHLFYMVRTEWFISMVISKSEGVSYPSIQSEKLMNNLILVVPIDEQLQIVEFLDEKTKEIDDMVQLEQKKIDLLKEYRQSLISEVVTGKIKVTTDE
jgi:type I restriction enzyme S subunit